MKKVFKILFAIFIPVLIYGCTAPPLPDLVWPEPPDEPKIKYIMELKNSASLKAGSGAADILLGSDTGGGLKKPMSVHVDNNGKVFVTDTAASDVFIFDTVSKKLDTLGSMGSRVFYKPIGITSDYMGRIFVTDSQVDKVAVIDAKGTVIQNLVPDVPFKQPSGIVADNVNKKLYVADTHTHDIKVFDLETLKHIKTIGKRGKEEGEFNFPSHITIDTKGNLYVVDTMNGRVQIFDAEGQFLKAFGQFGDAPGMFARPKGIGVDSEGHIYIADAAFNNIQIFDDEGRTLLVFASYGNSRGQMILPAGVTVDKDDFIYVVDSWNRRVEVFEYLGEKSKARASVKK